MLTKNPENAMVCDPVACAEMLCKLFYLLKLAALTGVDTAVAAPKLIHGTLRQSVELTPPPRDLNSTKPAPKNPVLPDSWVGSAFCFGGCWYANAGEAAIHNLQLLVFVLPDTKDDRAWDSFPWERVGTILATHFKADLDNLYEQTKELAARVKSEHDAYGARKDQRAVAAGPVERAPHKVGRLDKVTSEAKRMELLALCSEHKTMMNDVPALAKTVGLSESTCRRALAKFEKQHTKK